MGVIAWLLQRLSVVIQRCPPVESSLRGMSIDHDEEKYA